MRRIVITGLVLICVVALGSMAGTREPRSAVIDAATRTPTQVEVTNFPAVQGIAGTVNVGNLPAVQTVAGTVAVANLPAVQSVSGTVAVGNLPLDANDNVRVASASAAPSFVLIKIADAVQFVPSCPGLQPTNLGTFNVAGFRRATLFGTMTIDSQQNTPMCVNMRMDETFNGSVFSGTGAGVLCGNVLSNPPLTLPFSTGGFDVSVPEVTVTAQEYDNAYGSGCLGGSVTLTAWLYLAG